jgi:hypothetical protein
LVGAVGVAHVPDYVLARCVAPFHRVRDVAISPAGLGFVVGVLLVRLWMSWSPMSYGGQWAINWAQAI